MKFVRVLPVLIGSAVLVCVGMGQDVPEKLRTSLHQEVTLPASADRVYEALLSSKEFGSFSQMKANIGTHEGEPFKMFGGLIEGRNVELVPEKRIVQAWRPTSWKKGVYSIVSFSLKPEGSQTLVTLDHTGFPAGDFASLSSGWKSHYWEPLKKFLSKP